MIFQAELTSLVRTVLFILIVYYGFRFIIRYLSPYLFSKFIDKQRNKFQQTNTDYNYKKEGDITIKKPSNRRQQTDENFGDYVDYEEINEKD